MVTVEDVKKLKVQVRCHQQRSSLAGSGPSAWSSWTRLLDILTWLDAQEPEPELGIVGVPGCQCLVVLATPA